MDKKKESTKVERKGNKTSLELYNREKRNKKRV